MRNLIILLFFITSCNHKFLVNKENIVFKQTGIFVFIDKESQIFKPSNGDVFNDSLIKDFFIPFKFSKKNTMEIKDLKEVLKKNDAKPIHFFYIKDDCKTGERKICLSLSKTILLEKSIDTYLNSKKLSVLPVEIEYLRIKDNLGTDYYRIHKEENLTLYLDSTKINFILKSDYYDIVRFRFLGNPM